MSDLVGEGPQGPVTREALAEAIALAKGPAPVIVSTHASAAGASAGLAGVDEEGYLQPRGVLMLVDAALTPLVCGHYDVAGWRGLLPGGAPAGRT